MKSFLVKFLCLTLVLSLAFSASFSQKKKAGTRTAVKRSNTTVRKNTKGKTKTNITSGGQAEVAQPADPAPAPEAPVAPVEPTIDSLPYPIVKKSLRMDAAVDMSQIKDRTPLAYEHLRADDAVYRHKIWREIDTREKINLPFRYAADEDNGNQRFISILMKSIQDSAVEVFDPIDDRFTTPLTISQVAKLLGGGMDTVDIYDDKGNIARREPKKKEINLDSIYKFKIKEEVIFDKESSRLFWRILGIAPVRPVYSSVGDFIGMQDVFWVYYPDIRPVFAKYEIYNGKNYGQRMTWEELFESRMFSGRIIKSTMDNPFDLPISATPGFKDNGIFQLLEGERIKEKIFNYEQDLWSY